MERKIVARFLMHSLVCTFFIFPLNRLLEPSAPLFRSVKLAIDLGKLNINKTLLYMYDREEVSRQTLVHRWMDSKIKLRPVGSFKNVGQRLGISVIFIKGYLTLGLPVSSFSKSSSCSAVLCG